MRGGAIQSLSESQTSVAAPIHSAPPPPRRTHERMRTLVSRLARLKLHERPQGSNSHTLLEWNTNDPPPGPHLCTEKIALATISSLIHPTTTVSGSGWLQKQAVARQHDST